MKPIIIFIEGNIGAGKTTFLKNININKYKIQKLFEPVDDWIKSGMLDKFYKNPEKYSYDFQIYCLETRFNLFQKIDDSVDYVFIERSPMCDKFVFADVCLKNKPHLLQQYHNIWNNHMNIIYKQKYNYPYHFLYINETSENCHNHISSRNRHEELNISLEYLKELENRHNEWFNNYSQMICKNFTYHSKNDSCYVNATNLDIRKKDDVDLIINNTINYIKTNCL
jgi:deoxyadenosine/deoxycytidine kinase